MSQFVESLKRLFMQGKIEEGKILNMHSKKVITKEEMQYILGSE